MKLDDVRLKTKRRIFLFCWWLLLVVIWDVYFFSTKSQPDIFSLSERLYIFGILSPLLIFQSLFLWAFLKKLFPAYTNWPWVIAMPFLADFGFLATIYVNLILLHLAGA